MPHSVRTERLVIRPITLREARVFWRTHNHPDFARMTGTWAYPFSYCDVAGRITAAMSAGSSEKKWFAFMDGARLAGTGVLFDWQADSVELGYDTSRDCLGQGYAKEGARALCELAFSAFRRHTVRARVSIGNRASICILEALGFERTAGDETGWSTHFGRATPLHNYRLSRERFLS